MTARQFAFRLALVAACATVLYSCARRADLETPTEAQARARADAGETVDPQEYVTPRPDRPFILDKLIQ